MKIGGCVRRLWFAATAAGLIMSCAAPQEASASPAPPAAPPIPKALEEIRARVGQAWHDMRAAPHEAGGGEKVLYGTDDRIEVYETTDANLLRLANAACLVVETSELSQNVDGSYNLSTSPYTSADLGSLCPSERFYGEATAGFCSGFLVGSDLVATAGHCMVDPLNQPTTCGATAFIFDFKMLAAGSGPLTTISQDNVYFCTEIVAFQHQGDFDHAVVRLDRPVVAREPIPVRRQGEVSLNDPLVMAGHPRALPMKIAGNAAVKDVGAGVPFFEANLDAYAGNSGSMVVNTNNWVIEGIVVRGAADFVLAGTCYESRVCSDSTGCGGFFEEVSKSVAFADAIPALPSEGPPYVSTVTPDRNATISSLPAVTVLFTEPVTGVVAGSLLVGASPATAVTGSGAGPYMFSGFLNPPAGQVAVTLQAGGIKDLDGVPFGADQWFYQMVQPTPPQVQTVNPPANSYVAELTLIDVTFSEAVQGVTAGALTVNGSAAASVTGSGAGPYRFSGWAAPMVGVISVELAAAGIHDGGNVPFAGYAWSYQMHDCNGNGVADELDIAQGTSQDCNHNGVPDECDPGMLTVSMGDLTTLTLNESVTLGSDPTASGGSPPYAFAWNMPGNSLGESSAEANPPYSPSAEGEYPVTLTVTDGIGCSVTSTRVLTVSGGGAAGLSSASACGNTCGGSTAALTAVMLGSLSVWRARRGRNRRRSRAG